MELLDKKLHTRVKQASKKLGVPEREVVKRAVSTYLGTIDEMAALQKELRFWDILSAQTMRKYNF